MIQEKQIIQEIKADIKKIVKDKKNISPALKVYSILINLKSKSLKDDKQKLEFLESFKPDLIQMIKSSNYEDIYKEASTLLRQFFEFYASNEQYFIEGLKFFSMFPEIIKNEEFNPIKAFLFYLAYQTKKYGSQEVQVLLGQNLMNALILDNKTYLDFCMYCFYRGIYCLEKKDYYMTSYYYCTALAIGLKRNANNAKLINGFTCQMLRSLCFLRYLTKFNIKEALNREIRLHQFDDNVLIDHQDVAFCWEFLTKEKDDLKSFNEFVKEENENIKNCNLLGLKTAAEEEIKYEIIKDALKVFKRIRMSKIATVKQLEVNDIMKILKKKVLEGEINIKYDESEDIIEIYDIDPGLKERVKKSTDLYQKIMEGNKNMFIDLKEKKMDQLSGKFNKKEAATNIIMNDFAGVEIRGDDDYVPMPEDDD